MRKRTCRRTGMRLLSCILVAALSVATARTNGKEECLKSPAIAGWSTEEKLTICNLAGQIGTGSLKCYDSVKNLVPHEWAVKVCSESIEIKHVVNCVQHTAFKLDAQHVTAMCSNVTSKSTTNCYEELKTEHVIKQETLVMLCHESNPSKFAHPDAVTNVAKCFRESVEQENLNESQAAELCGLAGTMVPLHCYRRSRNNFGLPFDVAAQICQRATSIEAGICAEQCPTSNKRGIELASCQGTCARSSNGNAGQCVKEIMKLGVIDKYLPQFANNTNTLIKLIVQLCQDADSDAPVRCLSRAELHPSTSFEERVNSCTGIKGEDSLSDRIRCIKSSPTAISLDLRIALCNGTTTTFGSPIGFPSQFEGNELGPQVCAKALVRHQVAFRPEEIVSLCRANQTPSRLTSVGESRAKCIHPLKSQLSRLDPAVQSSYQDLIKAASIEICLRRDYYSSEESLFYMPSIKCLVDSVKSLHKSGRDPFLKDKIYLSQLCQFAVDDAPSACLAYTLKTFTMDLSEAAILCRARPVGHLGSPLSSMCCMKRVSKTLPSELVINLVSQSAMKTLCSSVDQKFCSAPSECMAVVKKLSQLPLPDAARLCQNARSTYEGNCARRLLSIKNQNAFDSTQVVDLCTARDQSKPEMNPLQCILRALPMLKRGFLQIADPVQMISFCSKASNGIESMQCVSDHFKVLGRVPTAEDIQNVTFPLCIHTQNASNTLACINDAKHLFRSETGEHLLCESPTGEGAIECARTLTLLPSYGVQFSPHDVAKFCNRAEDSGPAFCVNQVLRSIATLSSSKSSHFPPAQLSQAVFQLCDSATEEFADLRSECFTSTALSSAGKYLGLFDIAQVCAVATDPTEAELCISSAASRSGQMSKDTIVQLCKSKYASISGECAKNAPHLLTEENVINLCMVQDAGDNGEIPAACVSSGLRTLGWLHPENVVFLCQNTSTEAEAPILCAREISHHFADATEHQIAQICQIPKHVQFVSSCLQELEAQNTLRLDQRVKICTELRKNPFPSTSMDKFVQCWQSLSFHFQPHESDILSSVCLQENHNATRQCIIEAPFTWSNLEKMNLCFGSTSHMVIFCSRELSHDSVRFSVQEIIDTCSSAVSPAPVICARELSDAKLDSEISRHVCRGAVSTTPQQCLLHEVYDKLQGKSDSVTVSIVERCKTERAIPVKLDFVRTREIEEVLSKTHVADSPIGEVRLRILNQFGHPMGSHALRTEPGITSIDVTLKRHGIETLYTRNLKGTLRGYLNRSKDGSGFSQFSEMDMMELGGFEFLWESPLQAIFSDLFVAEIYGKLDLMFQWSLHYLHGATLTLNIERNLEKLLSSLYKCDTIPMRMQCLPNQLQSGNGKGTTHLLPLPWSALIFQPWCEHFLTSIGVKLVESQTLNPFHAVLLDVQPGPAKLISEIGIPTETMSPHEVLDISETADISQIRKAYHRASLEWHPDRWISFHPDLQAKAADIFSLVAEAKRKLLEFHEEKKCKGVDCKG